MGADEEGTHERLKAHLGELVHPKIDQHRGRIVKNTGDGFLAEFASVVGAVRCAVEIQRGMADREPVVPGEKRIRFRIGINLGDVIAEEHDIFGDGVNVAARLEALAEPGGICIARTVREEIRDKLHYPFEDMGEQSVKNIARPVRAYVLRPEAVAELPASGTPPPTPSSQTARAPRLSIIVLPFSNLGSDPEQQYFADGITDDLTTDLSRIADMFVISRNTAFTYRHKPVDTRQIGRALGVRYLLEGSVQRLGGRVRVNAQLIDAETDAHLWAERFEGGIADLFELQDEITKRIAVALNLELIVAETARPTDDPDALDYILRGRAAFRKPQSPDNFMEVISLFERALDLDPRSVEAQSLLATALASRVLNHMTTSAAADIARAERLVRNALAGSRPSAPAHYAKGMLLRVQGRYEEAVSEYETVIALDRSSVYALHELGQCKVFAGSITEAISLQQQAIRLSPRDPFIGNFYFGIGLVHLLQSRTDEAIVWLEKARNANPELPYVRSHLASAYGLKGQSECAAAELAEARRLRGEDYYSSISQLRDAAHLLLGAPPIRALYETTFFAGLRKAGMPEE
jgi:adenylate cyclase